MVIGIVLLINNNRRNQPSWLMVSAQKQFLKWYFWAQNEPILLRAEQSVCLQTDIHRPVWLCGERIFLTNILINEKALSCRNQQLSAFLVGVPGLEPGKAGPESAVLPLHHTPNWDWQSQCKSSAESLLFAEMQPDFAEHFLEMRCKGSGFFRNNKEKTHFFIKNPKIFCFYCTFRIIPRIFVGQNNIFNI